ncbi:hypothetical protein [Aeromonas sp. 1HA1]|uniref:hypothetical protein n=1 Tax=Aeromonas sp. 1HA1 TaxID=2699193 RepID=UPI0023DDF754|nr:hypothetical protein [Aeromonas sp. 1HA1]
MKHCATGCYCSAPRHGPPCSRSGATLIPFVLKEGENSCRGLTQDLIAELNEYPQQVARLLRSDKWDQPCELHSNS